jgi:hypothetical protein
VVNVNGSGRLDRAELLDLILSLGADPARWPESR